MDSRLEKLTAVLNEARQLIKDYNNYHDYLEGHILSVHLSDGSDECEVFVLRSSRTRKRQFIAKTRLQAGIRIGRISMVFNFIRFQRKTKRTRRFQSWKRLHFKGATA